jgi:hypothetical protein
MRTVSESKNRKNRELQTVYHELSRCRFQLASRDQQTVASHRCYRIKPFRAVIKLDHVELKSRLSLRLSTAVYTHPIASIWHGDERVIQDISPPNISHQ